MKALFPLVLALLPLAASAEGFSGPYVGASLGYYEATDKGVGYNQGQNVPNGWAHKPTPSGTSYGLTAGYNWRLGVNYVAGVEVDLEGREGGGSVYQKYDGDTDTRYGAKSKLTQSASIRARLGYLVNEQTLIYGTAGYAVAKMKRSYIDVADEPALLESHATWHQGWALGAGAEYQITKNLLGRVEYRYSDYGTKTVMADLWTEFYKEELTEQALKVGVVYSF